MGWKVSQELLNKPDFFGKHILFATVLDRKSFFGGRSFNLFFEKVSEGFFHMEGLWLGETL